MDLKEYFYILRKRISLIIVVTLVCSLASAILSYFVIKPVYKADISVIIGKYETDPNAAKLNYNDIMMYQKMVKTYSEFAKSRTVSEDVIKKLNLDMKPNQLLSMISVAPKGDTEFLTLTVKSTDANQAVAIANQIAKSLKQISSDIRKVDNVQLLDEAILPTKPDSPKPLLNIAIAFILGLMISVGVAFMLEYLDNTIKSQEEVENMLGVPVIGTIPLTDSNE